MTAMPVNDNTPVTHPLIRTGYVGAGGGGFWMVVKRDGGWSWETHRRAGSGKWYFVDSGWERRRWLARHRAKRLAEFSAATEIPGSW